MPCRLKMAVKAGDALLYSSDVYHRGTAHTDPNAPERVVLFLTFAGSRQGSHDHRSLPFGTVHSLHWRSWGHTIDDFMTIKDKPWRPWDGFIASKPNGVRPWTIPDNFLMIFRASIETCHMISDDFNAEYFSEIVDKVVWTTTAVTALYFWTSMLALIVYGRYLARATKSSQKKL